MRLSLTALQCGPLTTVQDAGRHGWRRFGVPWAGAMDGPALTIGNTLVGNTGEEAVIEFAHVGGTWLIRGGACRVAVVGGNFDIAVDGRPVSPWRSFTLRDGAQLTIGLAADAVWGYIAIAGGVAGPGVLGSCSTHTRSRMGHNHGSRIEVGDAVTISRPSLLDGLERQIWAPSQHRAPIRVVLGPQEEFFTPDGVKAFLGSAYRMSHRSDRMGCWLNGPKVTHARGYNIISDGVVPGCVQVPGNGHPLVLLRDCQTVGGYPKIATIVTADLPRFAQMMKPGREVTFQAVSVDEAQHALRAWRTELRERLAGIQDVRMQSGGGAVPQKAFRRA